jgi:hypothetical protein
MQSSGARENGNHDVIVCFSSPFARGHHSKL